MENFLYIGWIPCINGHLDFGLMRVGIQGGFTDLKSKDSNTVNENFTCSDYGDSHDRRIVLQSKVDWRDSSEFHKDSGKFRVIITAEVNKSHSMDDRYLSGNLLIYPLSAEPEDVAQRRKMNVHVLCHSIKNSKKNRHENFNRLEKVTSAKEGIDNLSKFSCSIKFKIEPNGITKLQHNSENPTLNEESKYLIARQAFYYLKYSIHVHKHHLAEQDSLTTITPIYKDVDDDKSDAGLRLICQLKRELTVLKRIQCIDEKEHPTNNAVGIVAYVKSLICSLEQSSIIDQIIAKREQERFEYINASFKAQNSKMGNQINNTELIKSKAKVWLGFIVISIWGSLNFMFKPEVANREAISSATFFTSLIVILATVFFIYTAIKKFYRNRQLPKASEHLYHISYVKILGKIIVALIGIVLSLVFLFMR